MPDFHWGLNRPFFTCGELESNTIDQFLNWNPDRPEVPRRLLVMASIGIQNLEFLQLLLLQFFHRGFNLGLFTWRRALEQENHQISSSHRNPDRPKTFSIHSSCYLNYIFSIRKGLLSSIRTSSTAFYRRPTRLKIINFVSAIGVLIERKCQKVPSALTSRYLHSYFSKTTGFNSSINEPTQRSICTGLFDWKTSISFPTSESWYAANAKLYY